MIVSRHLIPTEDSIVFPESSYFRFRTKLPSPVDVRASIPSDELDDSPGVATTVRFPHLGLFVKFDECVDITEGQCIWLVRHFLTPSIPVPEIYGWCKHGQETFLYMQLIQGVTLEERWPNLSSEDKIHVCAEIRRIVGSLHSLKQEPSEPFIGSITGRRVPDVIFAMLKPEKRLAGPFVTVKSFHDWFSGLDLPPGKLCAERGLLSDNFRIVITHADIHRENIMVNPDGPVKIVAILDWGQAGWYPDYWEYCKANWVAPRREEWQTIYIPQIFRVESEDWFQIWAFHMERIGAF